MWPFKKKTPVSYAWTHRGYVRADDLESVYWIELKPTERSDAQAYQIMGATKSGMTYILDGENYDGREFSTEKLAYICAKTFEAREPLKVYWRD